MPEKDNLYQKFMDTNQYSKNSILRYERIFGHTWVSTGGEATTREFCLELDLKPGIKVLDVGCGTGGSSFYMARHYGVSVEGIDLSTNMLAIANDRLSREEKIVQSRVEFKMADATKAEYAPESFDVIYSRDAIIHIDDKEALFKLMIKWLKPGGQLLISDYCIGDKTHSQEFTDYVKDRCYYLRTVKEYGSILQKAGFKDVKAIDNSKNFLQVLKTELKYFVPTKDAFIKDFSQKDYDELHDGWQKKVVRVNDGDHVWGLFIARK